LSSLRKVDILKNATKTLRLQGSQSTDFQINNLSEILMTWSLGGRNRIFTVNLNFVFFIKQ
jgi:hypothetical protein